MKIAFIHYHLKTGGVTTVLKQQVEVLRDTCDIMVLTGEIPESPFRLLFVKRFISRNWGMIVGIRADRTPKILRPPSPGRSV